VRLSGPLGPVDIKGTPSVSTAMLIFVLTDRRANARSPHRRSPLLAVCMLDDQVFEVGMFAPLGESRFQTFLCPPETFERAVPLTDQPGPLGLRGRAKSPYLPGRRPDRRVFPSKTCSQTRATPPIAVEPPSQTPALRPLSRRTAPARELSRTTRTSASSVTLVERFINKSSTSELPDPCFP
jgi:hypothetical protein